MTRLGSDAEPFMALYTSDPSTRGGYLVLKRALMMEPSSAVIVAE